MRRSGCPPPGVSAFPLEAQACPERPRPAKDFTFQPPHMQRRPRDYSPPGECGGCVLLVPVACKKHRGVLRFLCRGFCGLRGWPSPRWKEPGHPHHLQTSNSTLSCCAWEADWYCAPMNRKGVTCQSSCCPSSRCHQRRSRGLGQAGQTLLPAARAIRALPEVLLGDRTLTLGGRVGTVLTQQDKKPRHWSLAGSQQNPSWPANQNKGLKADGHCSSRDPYVSLLKQAWG